MRTDADDRKLLTVEEVAAICRVPPATIYRWNHFGTGPPRLRIGRHVLYPAADLWAWLDARREDP